MRQIKHTRDYSLFYYIPGNRPLRNRVKKMIAAIRKNGNFLSDYPVLTTKTNGTNKRGILDGQSRFEAAKLLGESIFFIEAETVKTIGDVSNANARQEPWIVTDYVESHAVQGNQDYIKLKNFMEEFKIKGGIAASLLMGIDPAGGSVNDSVRDGRFKVKNELEAHVIAGVLRSLKKVVPFAFDRSLVQAISRLIKVKDFDPERMIEKIRRQPTRFVKCASYEQYVSLIEELYNYRARRPSDIIPLSIEVKRLASVRSHARNRG